MHQNAFIVKIEFHFQYMVEFPTVLKKFCSQILPAQFPSILQIMLIYGIQH